MKRLSNKSLFWIVTGVVVVIILAWPVESWLECRERQVQTLEFPDAIYLVAGAIDQDRRIDALISFYSNLASNAGVINSNMVVLVGNDRLKSYWSREDQVNLTRAEWGIKNIGSRLHSVEIPIEIVPGRFGGTDGEMEALGNYIWNHRKVKRLVLVTSPFHVRRTLKRLAIYQPCSLDVKVITSRLKWSDRAPWTVLGELFKMGRDSLGFSRVPLLSRRVR